jgi:hypothetical protein
MDARAGLALATRIGMTLSLVRNIVQAIRRHRLAAYYAGALALTWAAWAPLVLGRIVVRPGGWPSHAPGLLGPALAALFVTAVADGRDGRLSGASGTHDMAELFVLRTPPPSPSGAA